MDVPCAFVHTKYSYLGFVPTMMKGSNSSRLMFSDKEIKSLKNDVFAYIGGLPVPFLGVDGTDACQHVKRVDSDEYVSCPLAGGHDYVYVNVFPILSIYPTLNTKVHWALRENGKSHICFEIPAAITNAKKSKN